METLTTGPTQACKQFRRLCALLRQRLNLKKVKGREAFEPFMLNHMLWGTEWVLGYPKLKGYGWQLD